MRWCREGSCAQLSLRHLILEIHHHSVPRCTAVKKKERSSAFSTIVRENIRNYRIERLRFLVAAKRTLVPWVKLISLG